MSKTHRNYGNHYVYRKPKTFNERKQLETLMYDDEDMSTMIDLLVDFKNCREDVVKYALSHASL